MSRLDWLLPRAGPRSLVDPLGTGEVRPRDGPDMGPTFDEILSGRLPGGAVNFSQRRGELWFRTFRGRYLLLAIPLNQFPADRPRAKGTHP